MRPRGFPVNSPLKVIFSSQAKAALEGVRWRERGGRRDAHFFKEEEEVAAATQKNFEFFFKGIIKDWAEMKK